MTDIQLYTQKMCFFCARIAEMHKYLHNDVHMCTTYTENAHLMCIYSRL